MIGVISNNNHSHILLFQSTSGINFQNCLLAIYASFLGSCSLLIPLLWFLVFFLFLGKSFLFIKDTNLLSYAKIFKFFCLQKFLIFKQLDLLTFSSWFLLLLCLESLILLIRSHFVYVFLILVNFHCGAYKIFQQTHAVPNMALLNIRYIYFMFG